MHVTIHPDRPHLGAAAAAEAEALLVAACRARGRATLVVATGASQFEVLAALAASREIPWETIEVFHLDEYVGVGDDHAGGHPMGSLRCCRAVGGGHRTAYQLESHPSHRKRVMTPENA